MTFIKNPKDFWTGVIYVAFGAAAFFIARDYGMGTASRMGPGYFPTVLSSLLMLIGAAAIVRSMRVPGPAIGKWAIKAGVLVLASVLLFGFLLPRAGFVIALIVLIVLSASASEKFDLRDWKALAGMIGLILFCVLVFVKGLGVPMPLLGSWFGG
jgi:hypothetical protein